MSLEDIDKRISELEAFEQDEASAAELRALNSAREAQVLENERGQQRKRTTKTTKTASQTVTTQHQADGTVKVATSQNVSVGLLPHLTVFHALSSLFHYRGTSSPKKPCQIRSSLRRTWTRAPLISLLLLPVGVELTPTDARL